jgi:hypothetical protein
MAKQVRAVEAKRARVAAVEAAAAAEELARSARRGWRAEAAARRCKLSWSPCVCEACAEKLKKARTPS